jgi:hypothetical protein
MSENEMQPTETAETRTVSIRTDIWHALLEIAGRQIDPETAEVCWEYGQVSDPYGVHPDPPEEGVCVGRQYFARSPGNEIWVHFGDLPDETRNALCSDFFVDSRKAEMGEKEMQSTEKADRRTVSIRDEIWHALLEIAGRQIDPENAEVDWEFGPVGDPYGVYANTRSEYCIGPLYFARNPGSRVWIEFGDLPDATREALESKKRYPSKLTVEDLL